MQQSKPSIHDLIHLDDAVERYISSILDQESSTIILAHHQKRANGNDVTSMSPDHDPLLSDALSRIKSSNEYKRLVDEIKQANFPPPPFRANQRKVHAKSFSLFDDHGVSSSSEVGGNVQEGGSALSFATSLPLMGSKFLNIRDVLECHTNLDELLVKAMDASVQDLILDFNTTQHEVELLANHLHRGLEVEVARESQNVITATTEQTSGSIPHGTYFGLHQKWFHDCMMEEEALSFAFLLVRNVILVSVRDGITYDSRLKLVHLIKEMKTLIMMNRWSDVGMFQREWFQLVYLWVRCSFAKSTPVYKVSTRENNVPSAVNSVHWIWVQVDPKGALFDLCLKCINSTWMIQLLFIQTRLVEYIRSVLLQGLECHPVLHDPQLEKIDDALNFGSLLCHTMSMFQTVILHSSPTVLFHLKDVHVYANAPKDAPVTLEMINNEQCWIQKHDTKMKERILELSMEKLSNENIQYIVAPFLVLMEIGLSPTYKGNDSDQRILAQDNLSSCQTIATCNNTAGDEYLVKLSAKCLRHILQSCGNKQQHQVIFNQVAKNVFGIASKIPLLACDNGQTASLSLAVVEYINILSQVSYKCDWVRQNDEWRKEVTKVVRKILSPLFHEVSMLQNTGIDIDAWKELLDFLQDH
jgi:hypothetical protein